MTKITVLFLMVIMQYTALLAQALPPNAQLRNIRVSGTGCNAQNTSVAMTSDLNFISVLYDNFKLELGLTSSAPKAKSIMKNCVIVLEVEVPAGWHLKFDSVEYRGFVSLPDKRTQATQLIAMEESGAIGNVYQENSILGPVTDNFLHYYGSGTPPPPSNGTDKFGDRPFRYGQPFKCANQPQIAYFRLRSRLQLATQNNNLSYAQLVVDSSDASLRFHMNWNRCL